MVKRFPQCLHRADLPADAASTEPVAAQDGQANAIFIEWAPAGSAMVSGSQVNGWPTFAHQNGEQSFRKLVRYRQATRRRHMPLERPPGLP